jgi:hypothetical protein
MGKHEHARAVERAILGRIENTGSTLVWGSYENGRTHRVRLVSNGVSVYSGIGASREEALADLVRALRLSFDDLMGREDEDDA